MAGVQFALLGDPVDHSLSPVMHRRALADVGLPGGYEAIKADSGRLLEEVERLRRGEIHGLNVTMPLKGEAARLCDRLTPEAESSDSVNTLKSENAEVVGHSTDVVAFTQILSNWPHHPLHVLGAGGSARAAVAAAGDDTPVYVAARRPEAVSAVAGRFANVNSLAWGAAMPGAVVINATPVGMGGESLPGGLLEMAAVLVDLPYGSSATPAVATARDLRIPVVDGIEFLSIQAAAAFHWWTGESVDSAGLAEEATKA